MAGQLHVIALISGGKDSLYSILHCVQNGHVVVALANLYPPSKGQQPMAGLSSNESTNMHSVQDLDDEGEDLNSFMYQTVGHSVIPLYEKALGLPLYRREITGSSITTDKYYSYAAVDDSRLDETEDLVPLLTTIMAAHPSANAISTGAIQSTYQRTRVESIALRLGLVPLGYLWQYPTLPPPSSRPDSLTGLLEDMEAAGCDARIIKIASGGIQERHLWANIAEFKTRQALVRGLSMYFENDELGLRGAVVGEGGEFETLALQGPRRVWRGGRIEVDVDAGENWVGEGGTSYVRLKGARVVKHEADDEQNLSNQDLVRVPGLLDTRFEAITESLRSSTAKTAHHDSPVIESMDRPTTRVHCPGMSVLISETTIQINNLTYLSISSSVAPKTPSEQMEQIAMQLPELITQISADLILTTSDIVHTVLLLGSMDTFAQINPIYASMFAAGVPNPPARVTISTELPAGIDLSLSVILDKGPRTRRRGLHVQSRSYWAPANIGPYSQAISTALQNRVHEDDNDDGGDGPAKVEIVHMAGQIPLLPASMELLSDDFVSTVTLALQHLWRAGQERQVDMWTVGVALLAKTPEDATNTSDTKDFLQPVEIATQAWREAHRLQANGSPAFSSEPDSDEEDNDLDIWDIRNNRMPVSSHAAVSAPSPTTNFLHELPLVINHQDGVRTVITPPCIAVEVTTLPRKAAIEWWSTGLTGLTSNTIPGTDPASVSVQFKVQQQHFGTRSSLTVMQNGHGFQLKTKFVTYLIHSLAHEAEDNGKNNGNGNSSGNDDVSSWFASRTITDILAENDSASGTITSGTVFLTPRAQAILGSFEESENAALKLPCNGSHQLLSSLMVIPCARLWGEAGQQVISTASGRDVAERVQTVASLEAAVLLRIDVKA